MADYLVTDTELTSIANAIRTKGGTSAQLAFPQGFADAVGAIPTGGVTPTGTKQISISASGTITEDVTNYASAEISVPEALVGLGLSRGPITNHSVSIAPSLTVHRAGFIQDSPGSGTYETVTAGQLTSGTLSITSNGVGYDVTNYASVDVNVQGGSQTVVNFSVFGAGDRICYIDGDGTFHNETEDAATVAWNGSAVEGSLVCVMRQSGPMPYSVSGLTELASISMGSRASYNPVILYKVGT